MASEIPRKTPSEKSFAFIFTLGQLFGILPLEFVNGVTYTWKSFKTVYCLASTALESIIVVMCFYYGYIHGWNFRNIVRTTFYTSNLCGTIGLFQLMKQLPPLMKKWYEFDRAMDVHYGFPKNLYRRTKFTSTIALLYASFQISMFLTYNLIRTDDLAKKQNTSYDAALYFKSSFPQIFEFIPYSVVIGILVQWNYIMTYLRMVYIELFSSLVSSFLSLRFQQITERLNLALDRKRSIEFWREVREDYDSICNLCKFTDEKISNIIFLAFAGNLILMLAYLRNCTMVEELNLQKAYNVCAFVILLARAILMVLYIAWVNDESKEPVFVLNSISSSQYNTEIQRFLLQISFDSVAFTGNRMFKVTRTLILDIGGVILTYELVLVQFADLNLFG